MRSLRRPEFPPPEAGDIPQTDVLGVGVSALTMERAVDEVARRVAERDLGFVTLTGVHGIMESQRDGEVRDIHNDAAMVCPDGMPMVWSSRWVGYRWAERVYGPDLMLAVCARSIDAGWRHYLYGGGEGVADQLAERLGERFPGLRIVGTHTPPFRELTADEERAVAADIDASAADLVWVGLSTPKQERWMARFRPLVAAPVLLGVGAAFDFHAGTVPQAPAVLQRSGLEWAYRLAKEPRRLWRRYLRNNPSFVARTIARPPRAVAS